MPDVDPAFLDLPFRRLAEAALGRAAGLGATYADFRFERIRSQSVKVHDRSLERLVDSDTVGFAVRVVHGGAWGFAAGVELTPDAAAATAAAAVAVASTLAPLNSEPVELASEPAYQGTWVSSYQVDPFAVPAADKVAFLTAVNERVLAPGSVAHVDFSAGQVLENKYFADLAGSDLLQQRVRVAGEFTAVRVDPVSGAFETMRSTGVPVGRGWEHFTAGHDYLGEADEVPELLAEKMAAPSVEPGRYDLVIEPRNLWLTIHESIGHATELDRVLGYEANYAGTSFATLDQLGTLRYGSPVMQVTGDRTAEHGLSTVAWDDEGVAAQQWDLIRDGVLVGYQLNRQMALKQGFGRSNGCAFADSPHTVPLQRMPNVSLQPAADDVTLDDLIGGVDRGIYVVADKSWSIDMQRYNFQFTAQRFHEIRGGRLAGQLKDVAYQGTTTEFWGSMEAVGGPSTYVLGGAFNCGKGQPGQIAPVSHGAPAALFRQVNVLNTGAEAAR
ncbi:MAG TPA: TldD/PmbA family protein [Acidimicrobiales bacterium]|nr:TldD/PmbA family protein [Acidimicrobiales bacterium]